MSALKDYTDLQNVINNIAYLTENETDDFRNSAYNYILYNFGNKTQSPLVSSGATAETIAGVINNMYSDIWAKVKTANNAEMPVTEYTEREETNNQIYGYNSTEGVNDYKTIKTFTKQHGDIYTIFKNALAFFHNNNYYAIIVCCIAHELTLPIYESEV